MKSDFTLVIGRFRLIFALLFGLGVSLPAFAASSSADVAHLHVQLAVIDENLVPGTSDDPPSFSRSLFQFEPGWHIYWQNPGRSGSRPIFIGVSPPESLLGQCSFPRPGGCPSVR